MKGNQEQLDRCMKASTKTFTEVNTDRYLQLPLVDQDAQNHGQREETLAATIPQS